MFGFGVKDLARRKLDKDIGDMDRCIQNVHGLEEDSCHDRTCCCLFVTNFFARPLLPLLQLHCAISVFHCCICLLSCVLGLPSRLIPRKEPGSSWICVLY